MLELLAVILLAICMLPGMLLRSKPFESIINLRQKRILTVIYTAVSIVNLLIVAVALHLWQASAIFAYLRYGGIIFAAVQTVVNIIVIKGRVREHLFVFGLVISCHYLLMSIPNYVVTFLTEYSLAVNIFAILGIYCALLLLTYWPLKKLVCNTVEPILHLADTLYWNTLWIIPNVFFLMKFISLGGEHDSGSIRQLIGNLLYFAAVVVVCMSIAGDQKHMREYMSMEQQLEGQKVYYAEMKVRVEEARKTKHDFKHHIAVIRHYIDINDREGLRSYCDELVGRSEGQSRFPYTGNVAADGVLYHYMQRSEVENIDFHYSGVIHSQGIADADLCVLLGNALDNALTACLTIPTGRRISVISQSEKHLLSVAVHNTFDGKIIQDEDGLMSRKRENGSGVGLSSMRSVCERYGGSMETKWDENTFTVMFMLPLTEDQ